LLFSSHRSFLRIVCEINVFPDPGPQMITHPAGLSKQHGTKALWTRQYNSLQTNTIQMGINRPPHRPSLLSRWPSLIHLPPPPCASSCIATSTSNTSSLHSSDPENTASHSSHLQKKTTTLPPHPQNHLPKKTITTHPRTATSSHSTNSTTTADITTPPSPDHPSSDPLLPDPPDPPSPDLPAPDPLAPDPIAPTAPAVCSRQNPMVAAKEDHKISICHGGRNMKNHKIFICHGVRNMKTHEASPSPIDIVRRRRGYPTKSRTSMSSRRRNRIGFDGSWRCGANQGGASFVSKWDWVGCLWKFRAKTPKILTEGGITRPGMNLPTSTLPGKVRVY
jgi:hypothetical protein